jgi:long-chain acyl-CoA synthetase
MLYNNQNKYTSALLVPNGEALATWARNNNVSLSGSEGTEAVLNELESVISQYKPGGVFDDLFPSRWLPSAIAIIDEPFSTDNKLVNSLGKLVRAKVVERHINAINYMYTPEGKNIVNQRNIEAIKKIFNTN